MKTMGTVCARKGMFEELLNKHCFNTTVFSGTSGQAGTAVEVQLRYASNEGDQKQECSLWYTYSWTMIFTSVL